ncbi:unnamed protein product [Arctia plantaginis]|nr:unnamed protein product [Arctia plantaginis]
MFHAHISATFSRRVVASDAAGSANRTVNQSRPWELATCGPAPRRRPTRPRPADVVITRHQCQPYIQVTQPRVNVAIYRTSQPCE